MTIEEMMHELDRIIDVGIVNAHHDKDVLKEVRKTIGELWNDVLQAKSCKSCAFAPRALCSPDDDVDSPAFRIWRDCRGSLKENWKWRLDER